MCTGGPVSKPAVGCAACHIWQAAHSVDIEEPIFFHTSLASSRFFGWACERILRDPDNSVVGVSSPVLHLKTMVATSLEHLCSEAMRASTELLSSFPATPTVKTIVVHHLCIIYPQLTTIVGVGPESVLACSLDVKITSPANGIVIPLRKAWPVPSSVAVVRLFHLSAAWCSACQIW